MLWENTFVFLLAGALSLQPQSNSSTVPVAWLVPAHSQHIVIGGSLLLRIIAGAKTFDICDIKFARHICLLK
jgi:hypothetical protein